MQYFPTMIAVAGLTPMASAQFGSLAPLIPTASVTRAELVDVDGDGVLDLVTLERLANQSQFQVSWSEGGAAVPFGPKQLLAVVPGDLGTPNLEAQNVDFGDVNGDGLPDMLVATTNGLLLLRGTAVGQFAGPLTIDAASCYHAQLIDADGDGDLDIARGGFFAPGPAPILFVNDGAGGLSPLTLPGTCCTYGIPNFADFDLDGDVDILLWTEANPPFAVFDNLGNGSYVIGSEVALGSAASGLSLGDVDLDGDADLLYSGYVDTPAGWVENVAGVFSVDHVVTAVSATPSAPRVADVNGDGDMDFILLQDLYGTSWYPNDGNESFLTALPIDGMRPLASIVDVVDVDGDLMVDIVFTAALPSGVFVYPNEGTLGTDACTANVNSTGAAASLRATGSRSVAAANFALTLRGAPPTQLAAFFAGRVSQTSTLSGSAGLLCLGAPFGIFRGPGQIAQTTAGGGLFMPIDITSIPAGSGLNAIQSGETWYFQSIFRDLSPLGATNLSPAVEVMFGI